MISLPSKDNGNWTLFLDRDGVINIRLIDDYVKTIDEFVFTDGFREALAQITPLFSRVFRMLRPSSVPSMIRLALTLSPILTISIF